MPIPRLCCRDEVGRRWQLLEEQRGQTQEPSIPGFIDIPTVEAASSAAGRFPSSPAAEQEERVGSGEDEVVVTVSVDSPASQSSPSTLSPPSTNTSSPAAVVITEDASQQRNGDVLNHLTLNNGMQGFASSSNSSSTSLSSNSLEGNNTSPYSDHTSPYSDNSDYIDTTLCLDENTFDFGGEETMQWLEDCLMKSLQEEVTETPSVATPAQVPTQDVMSHQQRTEPIRHHQPDITVTSLPSQHHITTSPDVIPTTSLNTRSARMREKRSQSYISIATDHDYSAKPGDRVKGQGHVFKQAQRTLSFPPSTSGDIEMSDDGPMDGGASSRINYPQMAHPPVVNTGQAQQNGDSSILVALLGNKNHHLAMGRYSTKQGATTSQQQHVRGSSNQQQQRLKLHSANISISAFPSADELGE